MDTKGRHVVGLSAVAAVAAVLLLGFDASAQDTKKLKTVSACKGLDEKACKGKAADCLWITPKKGKQRPYCRIKTASKKKT
ncbi:MAG: hypothetical protein WAN86_15115 [Hyphomicrobiaceae bacterium]